ncbi:shikimate dehydrogenase [Peribacillus frigoritolerans]|jgi:shikimate dehydrogenase|uniref:Shikimate dehydrogenase (NADP(+)) n=2 Tax=Peribacillus TaxID=2675229 RepID=A0AAW9NHX6_9BACI|nr:shikimate dehydrogenase [Peribacillus frigoritolerans]KOR79746.1 shikimate dehydrogenase [Bacillus sp. FJAT-21352]KOR86576.1 shikimate dehydrogenase [Bacillus sp. FJAT-22058]MEC0276275.1 shikimate dehydrogenase [Peribacillus castrilensis]MCY9137070.1 shikimate dehydrogenase [Peribacillus frigoritolerans]MDF1999960.1 shikimate dehydrogenase [Peribacillus frigoritolerans]
MKKIYGVMGDPIAHSMSPDIHNDAFEKENIEAVYHHFHVTKEGLNDAVKGMKALGIEGFNITIPHKTSIIPFLDEVDELALAIGAVNTVVNKNGRFIGYNTDGKGFFKSLCDEISGDIKAKKTLVIGAGGAARAIYFTLVKEGVKQVDIANRTKERAAQLVSDCPYDKVSKALSIIEAEESLSQYDLIIQTTSSGMSPELDHSPLKVDQLKTGAIVSDIIYNPLQTKLLREAGEKGAETQNGLGMFINQAALAFEIWTGVMPDTARMTDIVLNKLGGNTC